MKLSTCTEIMNRRNSINKSKQLVCILFVLTIMLSPLQVFSQTVPIPYPRIYVEDGLFKAGGKQIFINGGNTPWFQWDDFGGYYNSEVWDNEFARIKSYGGNASRIWITCSGEVGININADGYVSGATDKHWEHLDDLFALAEKNKLYILATLLSFDHTEGGNQYMNDWWWNMYEKNPDSFVDNYVIPFVNRYKDNPYLFAIEPCNEIETVHWSDGSEKRWDILRNYVARVVAAVHENSDILATVGNNIEHQSDTPATHFQQWPTGSRQEFRDDRLKAVHNNPDVYLDFYSPHFYGHHLGTWGNPFLTNTVDEYGLDDKPCIFGEMPACGFESVNIVNCYENAFKNGFQGALAWVTNEWGANEWGLGSLETGLGEALESFKNNHYDLVYPPEQVSVFEPNPSKGFLLTPDKMHIFAIFNIQGRLITSCYVKATADEFRLGNIINLPTGTYVMKMTDNLEKKPEKITLCRTR